jgi:glutamine amidotransferase
MNLMSEIWSNKTPPDLQQRREVVAFFADVIRGFGPAYFIYSDSEALFVHGHKRTQKGRKGVHPPGLFQLCRTCSQKIDPTPIAGLRFQHMSEKQEVLLIASVPLSNENWIPLAENELLTIMNGRIVELI